MNGTLILFLRLIQVRTLRIGLTGLHSLRPTRSSCSIKRAMWCSLLYQINKRSRVLKINADFSFVNLGLNARPTFFGCNASNFTSYSRTPPLVIYFPHTPWTAYTNFSTFTLEYSQADVAAYIQNGVATAVCVFSLPMLRLVARK